MRLTTLIRKRDTGKVAPAIPAIPAIQPREEAKIVARIATIAVATPKTEVTESYYYPTLADIDQLDLLINELCDLQGDSPETRRAMLESRRKMRPVLVLENIAQLRLWIIEFKATMRLNSPIRQFANSPIRPTR